MSLGRLGEPQDVSSFALFPVGESSYTTAAEFVIDGGVGCLRFASRRRERQALKPLMPLSGVSRRRHAFSRCKRPIGAMNWALPYLRSRAQSSASARSTETEIFKSSKSLYFFAGNVLHLCTSASTAVGH
jgi:hypothetical protein